ncbi:hypothetical protein QBC43DRAFT_302779 [Cladorrhinum sp. PSN259]|nr:hypothetical protein QBC43DRAFT_302779 [Cladorrhinum sp. PSN259]
MADQPNTDTPQFLAAEAASRLTTSLTTSGNEYFDQVVAVSQQMINDAIAGIHAANPDMNAFDGEDEEYGTISADLDPSQIIIPAGTELAADAFSVTWRTNFREGTIVVKQNGTTLPPFPINGWSVDVRVPLEFSNLDDHDDDTEGTKKFKAKQREWVKNNFEVAGDYRPERLYAKMAAARWNEMSFAGPSFTVNGVEETWEEWKLNKANRTVAAAFEKIIKTTWADRAEEGLTAIGTRFNLDGENARPVERPALFPPYEMIHQAYPYKIGADSGVTGWENGKRSLKEPGTRNCLLYCDNVSLENIGGAKRKKEMEHKLLPHSGNYATIGSSKVPGTRVHGTFALSHQLFFEKFLLPHLQVFVLESQIYPDQPTFTNTSEYGGIQCSNGYRAGFNPPKDPTKDPDNPIYEFKLIRPADGTQPYYQAHVDVTNKSPSLWFTPVKNKVGLWTMFHAEGSPTVTVKWVPGQSSILIEGKTSYESNLTTADHQNLDKTGNELLPASDWWHERFPMTWSMRIDVQAKDGDLDLQLSHDSGNFVTVTSNPEPSKGWAWTDPNTPNRITSDMQGSMSQQIDHLKQVLRDAFDGQYKFVYPGNGTFKFSKTMFNKNGDLLAEIEYKELPPNKRIVIPPVKNLDKPPFTEVVGSTNDGSRTAPAPRLTWTSVSPVKAYYPTKPAAPPPKPKPDAPDTTETPAAGGSSTDEPAVPPAPEADNRATFQITGTNTTTSPVYFSKITADLEGQENGSMLVSVINFITGRKGKQNEVQVDISAEPDASKVSPLALPDVTAKKLSSRWAKASIAFRAEQGPIAVQPGGRVNITIRSVTGKAGIKKSIEITEYWSDEKGATPEAGADTFKDIVWFELE